MLPGTFASILDKATSSLENLKKSSNSKEPSQIEPLLQEAKSDLENLNNYVPITPQERRDYAINTNKLNQNYQEILETARKNIGSQNRLQFDELDKYLLEERKEKIKGIEKNIQNIAGIMKDCSDLTKSQGELIDRIDYEVSSAQKNTKKGLNQVEISNRDQKIKRNCCIITILISCIIIIGVVVLAFVLGKA